MALRTFPGSRLPRPPYGPTAGMLQGLQLLQKGNITRVDEELLKANSVAPGNEYKVVGALRYLGVIDEAGRPTERSRALRTRGPAFSQALQDMVQSAYRPVLEGLDLRMAGKDELYNAFVTQADLGPEMAQKATRFLLGLCALAGIEVSPALSGAPRTRTPSPSAARPRRRETPSGRAAGSAMFVAPVAPSVPASGGFDLPDWESATGAVAPPGASVFAPAPVPGVQGVPLILAITPQTAELSEDDLARLFRKLFAAIRRAQAEAS